MKFVPRRQQFSIRPNSFFAKYFIYATMLVRDVQHTIIYTAAPAGHHAVNPRVNREKDFQRACAPFTIVRTDIEHTYGVRGSDILYFILYYYRY